MQILEHAQEHERTLLFSPARQSLYGPLPTRSRNFLRDGMFFRWCMTAISRSTPGTSPPVEQTVDEVISYLKNRGISQLDGAYGCSMGGACLTRMLALGEMPIEPGHHRRRDHALISCPTRCESCCFGSGCCCPSKWRRTAERFWKRPFRRNGSPPQGTTPKRSTTPWKPISRPSPIRTIRNVFWSANNYALPKRSCRKIGAKDHLLVRRRRKEGAQAGYPVHQALISPRRASTASPGWPTRSW